MNRSEIAFELGAPVYLEAAPGLLVEVLVTKHAKVIGRTLRVQVIPSKGSGLAWVDAARLRAIDRKGGK